MDYRFWRVVAMGLDSAGHRGNDRLAMVVLTCMVFCGAILLFGLEPLAGRLLTPYFGGAAHVWLTCLMFFQAVLFVGYLYAHLFARKLGVWHLAILALPLVNLPLQVHAQPDPHAPLTHLLYVLSLHVALPFAVLSTTAVVAQAWLSQSRLGRHQEPYPLYAASNAGSLIALLGYTFIAEPLMGVKLQGVAWSLTYVLYAALVAASWYLLRPGKGPVAEPGKQVDTAAAATIGSATYGKWLLLSCLPSAFLLAVTNYIALEVGSFPLTWILPLALYLGSFIVTFRTGGGVPRGLRNFWPEILLAGLLMFLLGPVHWLAIIGHLTVFFLVCLVCHGTLYELRPPASHLTNFYLAAALGGWVGGALISLGAPFVFPALYEYPIVMLLLAPTLWWCREKPYTRLLSSISYVAVVGRAVVVAFLVFLIVKEGWQTLQEPVRFRHRNFYGTYTIWDVASYPQNVRQLLHGRTIHGAQLLDPEDSLTPIMYYFIGGGIADVYETTPPARRMAVLGLGAGAAAAYVKPGDTMVYYEIDPDNEGIARHWFTFLNECKGDVRVVVGDGRLAMQKIDRQEPPYDIIHMDAFTGDGIPTHLLTREAVQIYLERLKSDGVILFHVSNRYYELRPIIKALASELGLTGAINVPTPKTELRANQSATWCVVLARDPGRLNGLLKKGWLPLGPGDGLKDVPPWTDDYINIMLPLRDGIRERWDGFNLSSWMKSIWPWK
jgi:hypothetical protein